MHQIRFPLGLRLRPRWRAYRAPPDPLAVFKEPTSDGREGRGGSGGKGRGRGDEGRREGREREGNNRPCINLYQMLTD